MVNKTNLRSVAGRCRRRTQCKTSSTSNTLMLPRSGSKAGSGGFAGFGGYFLPSRLVQLAAFLRFFMRIGFSERLLLQRQRSCLSRSSALATSSFGELKLTTTFTRFSTEFAMTQRGLSLKSRPNCENTLSVRSTKMSPMVSREYSARLSVTSLPVAPSGLQRTLTKGERM